MIEMAVETTGVVLSDSAILSFRDVAENRSSPIDCLIAVGFEPTTFVRPKPLTRL
jgi:hypothetical protein